MAQPTRVAPLEVLQDSLSKLGFIMYNDSSEPDRLKANYTFIKTLVAALKHDHSYRFPFDSLEMISIRQAPDHKFRMFTWHLPLNDGSFLYYGAIQMNTRDGALKLYPLSDKTYEIMEPTLSITSNDNWYGAQYYEIIQSDGYYVLLGWKGHNPQITQRVIEILSFDDKGVIFGKPVFSDEKTFVRRIFSYNRHASMFLAYDGIRRRIVFNHLIPMDEGSVGKLENYVPDLSYDAYDFKEAKLWLQQDIELLNIESDLDSRYLNPSRKIIETKSGF